MMINGVPSYCVSLELLLSDSTSGCLEEDARYTEISSEDIKNRSIYLPKFSCYMRWYVLFIYCASTFMQVVLWNTWSPIANSVLYAFPTWHTSTIALLSNWGSITFIAFIIPSCWLLNKRGIRASFLTAGFLCTIGSGVRCLPVPDQYFALLVHIGAIFSAIGGVMLGPTIVRLSSLWFPPHQRTSATGIGTACSQLGMAASYLVGPWLVTDPPKSYSCAPPIRTKIRHELHQLMLICFVCELVIFFLVVSTLPEKPPQPPSRSSLMSIKSRYCFSASIAQLLRNKDVRLLGMSAAFCSGITGPWLSLLTIMFSHSGLTQMETARLGFWTVICSCLLGLSVSKVSDFCPRHLKTILFLLILFADCMFLWILLLTSGMICFNKAYLVISVVCGLATVWSTPALFYELGVELAYPIPEGLVAGYMMSLNNCVSCFVYILLYISPFKDVTWLNYALVILGFSSVFTLGLVQERYNRRYIDDDDDDDDDDDCYYDSES